ncbi:MAG TPA: twin-arginine translocase TatA/TatE family subunit [Candidatus Acidoferrales bacterium]
MFSVAHLVVIFVVALVVFGPEKLPDLARNLGKVMGEFRRATGDLRSTFEGHMRDLEREADLRKAREAQPVTPAAASDAQTAENSSAVGAPAVMLPLSTSATSDAVDTASSPKDPPPPAGTIQSARPNSAAFDTSAPASPQQLELDSQQPQSADSSSAGTDHTSNG